MENITAGSSSDGIDTNRTGGVVGLGGFRGVGIGGAGGGGLGGVDGGLGSGGGGGDMGGDGTRDDVQSSGMNSPITVETSTRNSINILRGLSPYAPTSPPEISIY